MTEQLKRRYREAWIDEYVEDFCWQDHGLDRALDMWYEYDPKGLAIAFDRAADNVRDDMAGNIALYSRSLSGHDVYGNLLRKHLTKILDEGHMWINTWARDMANDRIGEDLT